LKFTFSEKGMTVSEGLRTYATNKISKLDKLFKTEAEAYVTFSVKRDGFLAEITIYNNGLYFRASELTNDMYASVDSGVAKIKRQIDKNKTRLKKNLREGAIEREAVPEFAPPVDDGEEEFKIVRSKHFALKPMTAEEAIMQMNLLGHDFFVFKQEADDGKENLAVVYKRKQGDYGIIVYE